MPKNKNTVSPAVGPIVVSETNPRYFTIKSKGKKQKALYLTGSHIWNNFHDGMGPGAACSDTPEQFNYEAYLEFLNEHGHNFIRLWRWEQFRSQAAGGGFHLCMTPQPWARTGPGNAKDGKPKFDLNVFYPSYFDRLRERVIAAGDRGIYVAVMLFDGWALHLSPAPDNIEGHPFHAENNVNGIRILSIVDYQVMPLDERIRTIQEAYIRKVLDSVHDLPNVLYEVANESSGGGSVDKQFAEMLGLGEPPNWGDSTEWQYWVINFLKRYEQEMGYEKHPVGMTMQFPVSDQTKVNEPLINSPADWISPGYDDEIFTEGRNPMAPDSPPSHWYDNPPANDGKKVIVTDTDHYAPASGDALWAWKSFLRGHHPILMDFGIIAGVNPSDPSAASPGIPPYNLFEPARYAMGDTLHYAQKMNLIEMEPRGELSSTGYVLANPGSEYLVLQPNATSDSFSVNLDKGIYSVEWFHVDSRLTKKGERVTVERPGDVHFRSPFDAPVVLYLKRTQRNKKGD